MFPRNLFNLVKIICLHIEGAEAKLGIFLNNNKRLYRKIRLVLIVKKYYKQNKKRHKTVNVLNMAVIFFSIII